MVLLSYGFGFMSRTTADKLASTSSERAVIAVLAPVCADKFRALPDVAARTATLIADKDNSYKMREAFPEGMITLPGRSYPDSDLTAACAGLTDPGSAERCAICGPEICIAASCLLFSVSNFAQTQDE
jgi:hypothetical protein